MQKILDKDENLQHSNSQREFRRTRCEFRGKEGNKW